MLAKIMEISMEWYEECSSQSDHITAKIHKENTKIMKKNSWDVFFLLKKINLFLLLYFSKESFIFYSGYF